MQRRATYNTALLFAALLGACSPKTPENRTPNLLLITLDTTRADHLSAYGYARPTSPNLETLAASGLRFDALKAPVPLTTPSHASLFTGLTPLEHEVRANYGRADRLEARFNTLAEHLKAQGYQTFASVGAFTAGSAGGLSQGFEHFKEPDYERAPERPADAVIDDAIRLLDGATTQPYFLWIHVFDAHGPYIRHEKALAQLKAPQHLLAEPAPGQHRQPEADILFYDGEIRFVDNQLTRLFEHQRVADEKTLIAVFGDHGESLTERPMGFQHGSYIYEEQIRVPGVLRGPGISAGQVVDRPLALENMGNTLLDLMGLSPLKAPAAPSMRASFAQAAPQSTEAALTPEDLATLTFAESMPCTHARAMPCAPEGVGGKLKSITAGRWKLIYSPHPTTPKTELYRLDMDPGERENLAERYPAIRQGLMERLREHHALNRRP